MSLLNTGTKPTTTEIYEAEKQLRMEQRRWIRWQFDQALVSSKASIWIEIAKRHKFFHLASEMEKDLKSELTTY